MQDVDNSTGTGHINGTIATIQIGSVFNRLTVTNEAERRGTTRYWRCKCVCGTIKDIAGSSLVSGETQSCGCLHRERSSAAAKTHGLSKSPLYVKWSSMKRRCNNPRTRGYADYGGRGISYDPAWESFNVFYEDMSPTFKEGLTLERIDNNSDYSKENCAWVPAIEQTRNKRKRKDNKTGVTGVVRMIDGRYSANWRENGETRAVYFSIRKHGEDGARQLAIEAREAAINRLRESGDTYSEAHGK